MLINKKNRTRRFCCFSGSQSENGRKQKDRQILGSCLRVEKAVEYYSDNDISIIGAFGMIPKDLEKRLGKQ